MIVLELFIAAACITSITFIIKEAPPNLLAWAGLPMAHNNWNWQWLCRQHIIYQDAQKKDCSSPCLAIIGRSTKIICIVSASIPPLISNDSMADLLTNCFLLCYGNAERSGAQRSLNGGTLCTNLGNEHVIKKRNSSVRKSSSPEQCQNPPNAKNPQSCSNGS